MVKNKEQILSLTGIRFYAALLVFISHLELFDYFFGINGGTSFYLLKDLGVAGVSIFFVLSGFVLFVNYLSPNQKDKFSIYQFYVSRFARVYPMFFIGVLFAVPLILLFPENSFSWFQLLVNLSVLKYFYPSISLINIPTWTIYVEAFFYAVFPLLGVVFLKNVRKRVLLFTAIFVTYIASTNYFLSNSEYITAGYFPVNRLLEFFVGMTIGYIFTHLSFENYRSWLTIKHLSLWKLLFFGVTLLIFLQPVFYSYIFDTIGLPAKNFNFYYYIPFSAFLILSLALLERYQITFNFLTNPWIILGGEISYAFYLLHRPILQYGILVIENFFNVKATQISVFPGLLLTLLLLMVCLILSYECYRFIETPFRQYIKQRLMISRTV